MSFYEENSRKVEESLFFESSLRGFWGRSNQPGTKAGPLSTDNEALGESWTAPGGTNRRTRASLGMTRADPTALHRLSRTGTRRGRGQQARPLSGWIVLKLWIGQEMLGTPQLPTS